MGGRNISVGTASEIKRRIWEGETQASVARGLNIDASTVSRICTGKLYSDVTWPNGDTGAISIDARRERAARARSRTLMNKTPPALGSTLTLAEAQTPEVVTPQDAILKSRIKRLLAGESPDDITEQEGLDNLEHKDRWHIRIAEAYERAEREHQESFLKTGTSPEFTEQAEVLVVEDEPDAIEYDAYDWDECKVMAAGRCKFINSLEDIFPDIAEQEMARLAAGTVYKAIELTVDTKGDISWNKPVVSRLIVETMKHIRENKNDGG